MIKKALPFIFIIFVWAVFSKPFLLDKKIPFPADLQANNFSLWSTYPSNWSPVKNPDQPDVISQIMPWKKFTIESLKMKEIPLWNPYSFSGNLHLANYQSSPFSITNFSYFIFNFKIAWALSVLVQPLLAGIFTYIFTKSIKRSETASLISAVSFMFCSFITTWMSYSTLSLAIAFTPLAIFCVQKYFLTTKDRYLLFLSITLPLSFFSGHFQTSIYFLFITFSFILFKLIETKNKKATLEIIIFSFLGLLISLPQVIPSLEFYKLSVRSSIFEKIEPVPFKYLLTIFSPDIFGHPVTRNIYFGKYAEWGSFFGTISFFLAIFGILNKNKFVFYFLFLSVVSLLISLNSPILDLLVSLKIPVISTSAAGRGLVILSFSCSILAGFGFDFLIENLNKKRVTKIIIWLFICLSIISFTLLVSITKLIDPLNYKVAIKNIIFPSLIFAPLLFIIFFGFLFKRSIFLLSIMVLLLVTFDLLKFSTKWQVFTNKNLAFQKTPIAEELQKLDTNYRILGPFGAEGSVYFGLPSTEGYDSLYINRYGELIGSLNDGKIKSSPRQGLLFPSNSKYSPKVFDLLGIKYLLRKKSDEGKPWDFPFKKYPNKFKLIYKDSLFSIYENKYVYPKAFVVGEYEIENSNQKIIDNILDSNLNLRKKIILEKNPKINQERNLIGEAVITSYQPNKILIKANSNSNSLLFLNDNYYPGWKVKVNGEEQEVLRADYTFRAAVIPKGKSNVEFYFEPKSFKLGLYLAIIGISSITILLIGRWYNNIIWTLKHKTAKSATKSFAKTVNGKQTKRKQKK